MRKFCSYQERCASEVYTKMEKFPLRQSDKEMIVRMLTEENFLDEERYARSVVKGKLQSNRWGRIKIRYTLRQKKIKASLIDSVLEDIDEALYQSILEGLAVKKYKSIKSDCTAYEKRQKTAVYLQSKGFEMDLIFSTINKLDKDE